MRKSFVVMLLLCLLGCTGKQAETGFIGVDVSGAKLGDDLGLSDAGGKIRHISDFKGKVVALFFGYTHCPDICPTTLSELARAMKFLVPRDKEVQVLFVTLDPDRDTEDVLKRYVPSFNPGFIGLRGDEAATKRVAQDFKIFYARQESGSRAGYSIDHSAGIYVFDRKGNLRLYLNPGQGAKDIAGDLGKLLNE